MCPTGLQGVCVLPIPPSAGVVVTLHPSEAAGRGRGDVRLSFPSSLFCSVLGTAQDRSIS